MDDYVRLFAGAVARSIVGECTTFYLSSRVAAADTMPTTFKPIISRVLKDASASRFSNVDKTVYCRGKTQVVSVEDLARVGSLLQAQELDPFMALAA